MAPIVRSDTMRAAHTRYDVPGWGVGELWTRDGVVLVHELEFDANAGVEVEARLATQAAPREGALAPPTSTVPIDSERVGRDFVPEVEPRPARASAGASGSKPTPGVDELVERFLAFFTGADPGLDDVAIDLDWATPFQHEVAETLRAIPRGEVVSYGELAALAGYPGAARAVGTFCAHNRFMLLVPCHRVVGASGLGGYGSAGLGVKRRLLALEGVRL